MIETEIKDLILKYKLTLSKEVYKKIYTLFRYLLDEIYEAFLNEYPFLKNGKIEFYYQYNFSIRKAIAEYDFCKDDEFPGFFKLFIIKEAKEYIQRVYSIRKKKIISDKRLYFLMGNSRSFNKTKKRREELSNGFGQLSAKRLQAVCCTCFLGLTKSKACDLIGITFTPFFMRGIKSYGIIRDSLLTYRNKKKKNEHIYETFIVYNDSKGGCINDNKKGRKKIPIFKRKMVR